MRLEQCPKINQSENIQELAKIAGMSVKEYKRMRDETEQAAFQEQLRKEGAVQARIEARVERDRRNLMEETQTFSRQAMSRSGGLKRIKAGGRTSIAA
jgi:threonyl-tRNA synthetase